MAVLIKRYANRKLYNTQTSRYITLKGIADLLDQDEEVRVIDNETGEDITSITLSQILVDTERSNRAVPGSLLSGLFQRGGDVLYGALRRSMDDASEGLEGIQHKMRRLLRGREEDGEEGGERGDWIAFTPPDLDRLVQRTMERVFKLLDLPRRSDIEALSERLDRVASALEALDKRGDEKRGNTSPPAAQPARPVANPEPEPAPEIPAVQRVS